MVIVIGSMCFSVLATGRPRVGEDARLSGVIEGFAWLGLILAVVVACAVAVRYIKGRIRSTMEESTLVFNLEDLRRLRDNGDLTLAEYETLRRRLVDEACGGDA